MFGLTCYRRDWTFLVIVIKRILKVLSSFFITVNVTVVILKNRNVSEKTIIPALRPNSVFLYLPSSSTLVMIYFCSVDTGECF